MKKKIDYKKQGKRNLEAGRRFENKVRKDLESKGRIVSRWGNNVEFGIIDEVKDFDGKNIPKKGNVTLTAEKGKKVKVRNERYDGKLIPAKQGKFRKTSTGFPDFVVWHKGLNSEVEKQIEGKHHNCVGIFGVEVKSDGYLSRIEREKCRWYLINHIFIKILIAKKGKKRGEIEYIDFK